MKRSVIILSLLVLSLSAFAQAPPPKPELYLIHEEVARPSMIMQYEAVTRDFLNAFTEKKADPKIFGMNLYLSTDMHYIYVVPIANWAALDTMMASWMTIGETIGKEKWRDLMNRGNAAMISYDEFVVMRRPDLSYAPANPRLKMEEHKFHHLMFYYLDAGGVEEAEKIAKDYVALFKSKNISEPFDIFQSLSGTDLPVWVVSVPARSAADFYATEEKVNATLGDAVRPLQARALAVTRKFDVRDVVARPEMSYPLPTAK